MDNTRDNQLLRMLIDQLPDLIYIKDRDSRFLEANLSCARNMGVDDPSELLGKTDEAFYASDLAALYRQDELQVMESGEAIINKYEPLELEGRRRIILTSKLPLRDDEGNVTGILGIGKDVTELQKAQELSTKASRMEAVATLAGGIAHKVNNLMAIIMCNVSILRMEGDNEYLNGIDRSAKEAGNLAHQMLAFASSGRLISTSIDISEAVREFLDFETAKKPEGVEIVSTLSDDCETIQGDPRQLDMVLLSVIRNAIEAVGDKGVIRISTYNVDTVKEQVDDLSDLKQGRYVCLRVEDNGCGMEEDTAGRIFEPFFSTKFQGRGLSLSAAHGIVIGHGGHMAFDTQAGAGTSFRVYFPASEETHGISATQKRGVERAKTGEESILVVDDEISIRKLFRMILEKVGYDVKVAANGSEAVDFVRDNPGKIDLVVLDMEMPVMGGREAYPLLKEADPNIRILICSGYGAVETAKGIIEEGDDYVEKPLGAEKLSSEIRRLLDKE